MLHKQYLTRDQFQGNLTKMTRWSTSSEWKHNSGLQKKYTNGTFLNTSVQGTKFGLNLSNSALIKVILKAFFFFLPQQMKYMKQINSGVDSKTFMLTSMDGSQNIVPLPSLIIIKGLAVLSWSSRRTLALCNCLCY